MTDESKHNGARALSKKDINKLLNDLARACTYGEDSVARMAASKAIHEYLDAAFAAISSPEPAGAVSLERVIEWIGNNYQDHPNLASLFDAMRTALPTPAPTMVDERGAIRIDDKKFLDVAIKHLPGDMDPHNAWLFFQEAARTFLGKEIV